VGDVGWWIGAGGDVDDVGEIKAQEAVADFRSGFPVVGFVVKVAVEKAMQVVDGALLVEIVPLLVVMDSKPACRQEGWPRARETRLTIYPWKTRRENP
jgi:hypothetical protein